MLIGRSIGVTTLPMASLPRVIIIITIHLYYYKMRFCKRFILVKMVFPCLHFKATPLNFCALTKAATVDNFFFLNFLKVMLFCSTSGKMASFLVRPYSKHDVHIMSVSNVQSESDLTSMFMTRNEEKRMSALRPKMTFIRRRDFTFTNRFSIVFVGRT